MVGTAIEAAEELLLRRLYLSLETACEIASGADVLQRWGELRRTCEEAADWARAGDTLRAAMRADPDAPS